MAQFADKSRPTVLITGCSAGGIGSALAEAFHGRGLHVFATARSRSKMSHLENLPNITLLELDVVSPSSVTAAVEAVSAKTDGKLDYLINNSGQGLVLPALDTDINQAKKIFDVNYWGTVNVTHAFVPLVIASKGTIANGASLAAVLHVPWGGRFCFIGMPFFFFSLILNIFPEPGRQVAAFYNSSKAAVRAYSESLRLEMAPFGVKVVTIMTGIVATKLFDNCHDPNLSEKSLYKGASKQIGGIAGGSLKDDCMTAPEYAKRVANDVLGGASGSIWRGKMASMAWVMNSFFPTWLLVSPAVVLASYSSPCRHTLITLVCRIGASFQAADWNI